MIASPRWSARTASCQRRLLMRRVRTLAGVAAVGMGIVVASGSTEMAGILSIAHGQTAAPWPGFADVVDRIRPAVISVRTRPEAATRAGKAKPPPPDESPLERFFRRFGQPDDDTAPPFGQISRQGSGFFISPDGYAVTNNHVVDGLKTVEVTTDTGKLYTARVIGADDRTDIALIKVDGRSDFPTAKFAERIPRVGDWVLAVGNPFGLGGTVTAGIVSARGRDIGAGPYDDFIQIDAPVNQGNSGGPTFDIEGNVIGVNTAIVSPSGGSVGIGFAIPADTVKSVIAQLRDKGRVTRGWIGVQIQSITPEIAENLGLAEARGALVAEPEANGPASKSGIEPGDIIVAVNGKEVADSRELARTISSMPPGTSARLTVVRKGQAKTVNITLGELPEQRDAAATADDREPKGTKFPQLGFTVAPKPGSEGVVVTAVDDDGAAAEYGLKTGDVILEAGGKKVASAADLRNAVQAAEKSGKKTVLMRVKSGTSARYVTLPVGRG
jgi:serine protease Do